MPRIKPYGPRVEAVGPVSRQPAQPTSIASGLAGLGKGIEDFGTGLHKRQENAETILAAKDVASLALEKQRRLNELSKEGVDDNKFNAFIQEFDSRAEGMLDKYTTSGAAEFFNKQSLSVKTNLQEKYFLLKADQAAHNTLAAFDEIDKANDLLIKENPDWFSHSVDKYDELVSQDAFKDVSKNKKDEAAVKIKNGWAHTYITSVAEQAGPQAARKKLKELQNDDRMYGVLGGKDIEHMQNKIDQEERARRADASYKRAEAEIKKNEIQENYKKDFIQKLENGTATRKDATNPVLDAKDQEHALHQLETRGKKAADDPAIRDAVRGLIASGKLTNKRYLFQYRQNGLSEQTMNTFEKAIDAYDGIEGNGVKELRRKFIEQSSEYMTPESKVDWLGFVVQQEAKLGPKIQDITQLYIPSNPESLWKYQAQFLKPLKPGQQRTGLPPMNVGPKDDLPIEQLLPPPRNTVIPAPANPKEQMGPPAPIKQEKPKAKPGETPQQYLDRIGK